MVIKKNGDVVKCRLRTSKYLYTLVIDEERLKKLELSLPPSLAHFFHLICSVESDSHIINLSAHTLHPNIFSQVSSFSMPRPRILVSRGDDTKLVEAL